MPKPPTHLPCGTAHWSTEKCPATAKQVREAMGPISTAVKLPPKSWSVTGNLVVQAETDRCRELVATWMIANGFATGHGDTLESLLAELGEQTKERLDELLAFRVKRDTEKAKTAERVKKHRTKHKGE